jgi:hypothetical protein
MFILLKTYIGLSDFTYESTSDGRKLSLEEAIKKVLEKRYIPKNSQSNS